MKKRILSVLLCLSMAVGMLAGCGSEEDAVKVTKKLEEQYIARIEAYQGYLDEIGDKYSEYEIGATITLDKDGLPLFWLCLGKSESGSYNCTTQLVGYEDKQATVLAEKGEAIVPYRGQLIMAQAWDDDAVYLYDEEEMNFVSVTDKLEYSSDDYDTIYSEKELDEKVEDLTQMLECTSFYDTIRMAMNDETHQLVYLGKSEPDFYYQALGNLHVLLPVRNTKISDATDYYAIGLALRKEYAENKDVLNYFKQLEDAELEEDIRNEILSNEETTSYMYDNMIKAIPSNSSTYMLPDGTVCTHEEALNYAGKIDIFTSDGNWEVSGFGEAGEYFDELSIERILRELQKKPIYSQEELFLFLVSVAYNCEIIEVNLDNYILTNASDNYISGVVEGYIRGSSSYESFYTDELIDAKSALLETEPYRTIKEQGVDESSFENNIETLLCYNGNEYQFQIEFNEDGDKISKIEYIDPYANLSEWQKIYLNQLDMSRVWYPSLVDINNDDIPEIVACSDEGGGAFGWCIYYIDKANTIRQIYDVVYGSFNYGAGKIYSNGAHSGVSWDSVYSYNTSTGAYDLVFDGNGLDNFDEEGNYYIQYQISGEDVSEEEYRQRLDDFTTDITNNYGGNENVSQDTNVTDLIMKYDSTEGASDSSATEIAETDTTAKYYDSMYRFTIFSLENQRLKAETCDGEIVLDLEVSDDCLWQSRYTDGSVYESSFDDLHRIWEDMPQVEDVEVMGYDSAEGLGIEVEGGKVVAVYMTAS